LQKIFLTTLFNFFKKEYISTDIAYQNKEFQCPISSIYCGIGFENNEDCLSNDIIFEIKTNILEFCASFCDQIKQRFSFEDQDAYLLQYNDRSFK